MDDQRELSALLRSNPLFQDLQPEELGELARRPAAFRTGEILFRQGTPADRAFLLAKGSVSISTRVPGDERVSLAEMGRGEVVGETALNRQAYFPQMASAMSLAGFGMLAWDPDSFDPGAPFAYRSVTLPNFDANLKGLAQKVRASCLLAHVRGVANHERVSVSEHNLHPFHFEGVKLKTLLWSAWLSLLKHGTAPVRSNSRSQSVKTARRPRCTPQRPMREEKVSPARLIKI